MRHALALIVLLFASPAAAGPITATLEGWYTLAQFDAIGSVTWTADIGTPYYLFHDPKTGVGHSEFDEEPWPGDAQIVGDRLVLTLYAWQLTERCGFWQPDVGQLYIDNKSIGVDAMSDCAEDTPPIIQPPIIQPEQPDVQTPEPSTMIMVGSGLLWLAWRRQ